MKKAFPALPSVLSAFTMLALDSCMNRPDNIPFPNQESEYRVNVETLRLGAPVHVKWDSASQRRVYPLIKKFDFNKLASRVFDSSGFRPFTLAPKESRFNWDSLPAKDFDLDRIPANPLSFETSLVEPLKLLESIQPKNLGPGISALGEDQFKYGEFFPTLLKDRRGPIWIPTEKALFQYDGANLRSFPFELFYSFLAEDKNGNIWMNGFDLNSRTQLTQVFDMRHGTVKLLTSDKYFSSDAVYGNLINDNYGNNWLSSPKKGIYVINQEAGTIKNISNSQGLSDSVVTSIRMDGNGLIWIGTPKGIDIVDQKEKKIKYLTRAQGLSYDGISCLNLGNDGQIICCNDSHSGNRLSPTISTEINIIDIRSGIIKHLGTSQGFEPKFASGLLQNSDGTIFLGSHGKGIDIINLKDNMFKNLNATNGLVGNSVVSMEQDSSGTIWAATPRAMNIIGTNGINLDHIGKYAITSMTEDSSGRIWISYNHGADIFDPRTGLAKSITTNLGLSNTTIQNLWQNDGKVYFSTFGGLDIVDLEQQTIEHIGKAQGLSTDTIQNVVKDKNGKLWINVGKGTEGWVIYDPTSKQTVDLYSLNDLIGNNTMDFRTDTQNNLWITNDPRGVDILNMEDFTLRHLENIAETKGGFKRVLLSVDGKGRMWIVTDNNIYIADILKNTLVNFQFPHGSPMTDIRSLNWHDSSMFVRSAEGLRIIIPPAVDSFSSAATSWRVESYDRSLGLIKLTAESLSDLVTKKGEFWWGDSGITRLIKPNKKKEVPNTFIRGFDFLNEQFDFSDAPKFKSSANDTIWSPKKNTFFLKGQLPTPFGTGRGITWDSVAGAFNMPVNLQLPHDLNVIRFLFTGTQPGSAIKIRYRYILEGVDKKWRDITDTPYSQYYLNLAPGEYRFKVVSKGYSGIWSAPAEFSFVIKPPWWRTDLAYAAYLVTFIGFVYTIVAIRSRALRRENKKLEEKIGIRTAQLSLSIENLKTTQKQLIQSEKMASFGELTAGIAHEIQNPLNFVNNFSEVNNELIAEIKKELDDGNIHKAQKIILDIGKNMERIADHGRRADSIVKNMLHHSRSAKGQIEPTDINALAEEFLRLSYHGFRTKDKSFHATLVKDLDPAVGNVHVIPQELGRVLLNLYNNAFYSLAEKKKHSPSGYEPIISVTTKKLGEKFEIRVKDNGAGIPQQVLNKIFQPFFTTKPSGQGTGLGLSLSYEIVKAHAGEIKVETKEGEGAEFVIQLPQTRNLTEQS